MDTIKICSQANLTSFGKLSYMKDFTKNNPELFKAANEITNLTIFRHYVKYYLINNQDIHNDNFTFLVRLLDPTPTGLPIELYVFTKDTKWANYENTQAEIFEHLLAVLPKLGLRPYQTLSNIKNVA
jgi:miniconductance mechanosensitive channel